MLSDAAAADNDNNDVKPAGIGAAVIDRVGRIQFRYKAYLFIYLFIYLFVCLFVCLFSVSLMNVPDDTIQLMLTSPGGVLITVNNFQNSPNRANVKDIMVI